MANGSSSTLPWVVAIVATAVAAGALGFAGGRFTAPEPVAMPAPAQPAQAEANAPPGLPAGATSEKIEDWTLYCQAMADGKKTCFATQDVARPEGGLILAVLAGYDVKASRTMLVRAPLGVQLDRGVEFKFGDKQQDIFAFGACGNGSCDAVLTMTEDGFTKLSEAGSFELAYTRGDGVRVPATISMKGLAKAYESIERPVPPAEPAAAVPAAPAPDGTPQPTPKPAGN